MICNMPNVDRKLKFKLLPLKFSRNVINNFTCMKTNAFEREYKMSG